MIRKSLAILLLLALPASAQNFQQHSNWIDSQVADALTISGGTVNNSVIGGVTPAAGSFTTGSFAGHVTFASDNTYDIGTLGANRPRNVNVANDLRVGVQILVNTTAAALIQPGVSGDLGSWGSLYNIRSNTLPIVFTTGATLGTQSVTGTERMRISSSGVTLGSGGTAISKVISATAALDFASTAAQTHSDLTITVTGAAVGDVVALGVPNGSVVANSSYAAWVSAADTVTVRLVNAGSAAQDPASGTFRAMVTKF